MSIQLYNQLLNPEFFFENLSSLSEEDLLGFIRYWHDRGETGVEIKCFVDYILKKQKPIDTGFDCYDCCGTGGDKANTFNISTAAAIVAAACGVKVTKHGGRSTTSKSGSVDVLEKLGVNLEVDLETKLKGLKENNLAFFASKVTGEMLAPVKQLCKKHKETGFVSLIGPLTNPVKLSGQVLGVGHRKWMSTMADLLTLMKRRRALIVHSASSIWDSMTDELVQDHDFRLDELSVISPSWVIELKTLDDGTTKREEYELVPEDFGIPLGKIEDLKGGDSIENAQIIRDIIEAKEKGTKLNAVCLNAGAMIYISGEAESLKEGFKKALSAIENAKVIDNFQEFIKSQN